VFATFLDRQRGIRLESLSGQTRNKVTLWTPRQGTREFVMAVVLSRFGPAAAASVPSLLMPREFGRGLLDDFHDSLYQGQEIVGTSRCHRIFGHWRDNTRVTLWLDETHFLVRRLVDRTEYPYGREAAELRRAHLDRRAHAIAAGISRLQIDRAFGAEDLLAIEYWPYARPRADSQTITRVAYDPKIDVPLDEELFKHGRSWR
jgi:hypothetical protein